MLIAPTSTSTMSIPLRQRLKSEINCTPQDTLTGPRFSFQNPAAGPLTDLLTTLAAFLGRRQLHNVGGRPRAPLHSAQTVHEVVAEEFHILESVNYVLVTCTPADWVCLFEVGLLRVQHLRQRFPQGTGSLLSLLSRVPSGVLASVALCIANDYVQDRPFSLDSTPRRIGSSAWFLSCVV